MSYQSVTTSRCDMEAKFTREDKIILFTCIVLMVLRILGVI